MDQKQEHPKGALAITALYLLLIIVLWGNVFVTLLQRGVTR